VSVQREVAVAVKQPPRKKKPHRRRRHGAGQGEDTDDVHDARAAKQWRTVDSDLGLNIVWTVDDNGAYNAHWEVPLGAPAGRYRFTVRGNRYLLVSSPFLVKPSHALTAVPTNAPAGRVAVELHYPDAVSRESVGDPPGDLTADLTDRPAMALSGLATFRVNGRAVTVSERGDGAFEVPAPAGATVEVRPGRVTDIYGNANGNTLTLTP
jgi:hypothetical protein